MREVYSEGLCSGDAYRRPSRTTDRTALERDRCGERWRRGEARRGRLALNDE